MSRIAHRRAGYKTAILIAAIATALMSQVPASVPGPAPQRAELLIVPAPWLRFDASLPPAAGVRFDGDEGDGSAIATF